MTARIRHVRFLALVLAFTLHGVWVVSASGPGSVHSSRSPAVPPEDPGGRVVLSPLPPSRTPSLVPPPVDRLSSLSGLYRERSADERQPATEQLAVTTPPLQPDLVPPQALEIPSLGVTAAVVPVSVLPSGELALPTDPSLVSWYQGSSYPGQPGRALMAGHLDTPEGRAGVFAQLHRLVPGAEVTVVRADGARLTYTVVDQQRVASDALPPDLLGLTPVPELVLVTCAGRWLPDAGRYSENLLVRAVLSLSSHGDPS